MPQRALLRSALLSPALLLLLGSSAPSRLEAPLRCSHCDEWNQVQAPFRIYGNTYYVGTQGLSAILVTGPRGHVLLDAALPQSAAQIRANIEALGFRVRDVKWILNSHAHFDHAGGIAAMQAASGARVAASASGAATMRAGDVSQDDPQFDPSDPIPYPPVARVEVVRDGQVIAVGPLKVQALMTPGHTPGSTSWTWTSCEGKDCRQVVYSDSLTAVSLGDFRFSGGKGYPDVSRRFAASIARVGALKCDIVLSTHPGATELLERHAASTPTHNAFLDPNGCKALAERSAEGLREKLADEARSVSAPSVDKH